ncbi:hypothetical protein O9992_27605 [Vibrio lentus]|nr:hypothetical protein [Vibrio lentus]
MLYGEHGLSMLPIRVPPVSGEGRRIIFKSATSADFSLALSYRHQLRFSQPNDQFGITALKIMNIYSQKQRRERPVALGYRQQPSSLMDRYLYLNRFETASCRLVVFAPVCLFLVFRICSIEGAGSLN